MYIIAFQRHEPSQFILAKEPVQSFNGLPLWPANGSDVELSKNKSFRVLLFIGSD